MEPDQGGLRHADASVRLRAAMRAGATREADVRALVDRCAVEPDFFVRDMLTWALTRHPAAETVPLLLAELGSPFDQARSQALHTLSKVGDGAAWPAVAAGDLLHDEVDEVAKASWRAAVRFVPTDEAPALAEALVRELGRGDRETQRGLSRALAALGEPSREPLTAAERSGGFAARAHAAATLLLLDDPDADFAVALEQARHAALLPPGAVPPKP